ncbi:hypothetical protein FB451DRAFT_1227019 [Mycena latifolia]|nr:hypothetical protein FB451DRAFT_1227019 [Mycena latifolia]
MATSALPSISALPAYTPSAAVPSYSPELGQDERLIERAPHSKSRRPSGNYIQKSGRDTVVLTDQEENADIPTYGRQGHINGFVSVDDREAVVTVVLTIKGKIDVAIAAGGFVGKTVVDEEHTLWPSENGSSTCPSNVPFSAVLPATFAHGDAIHPLPPSYSADFLISGGLDVKVSYTLSILVVRTRKLSFMSAKNTTSVRFNYAPRSRPGRPIQPPLSDFLADIKVMPEEWRQTTAVVAPALKSTAAPVHLHLFIPVVEVFALGDMMPFHVQLTGPVASLRAFLPADARPVIQVSLVRQLLAGHTGGVRFATAHATLASAPPGASARASDAQASLDWTGQIECRPDIQVGSFDAGILKVQDFIVVDIVPSACASSQFARARHAHPVRIVSDSWPDT